MREMQPEEIELAVSTPTETGPSDERTSRASLPPAANAVLSTDITSSVGILGVLALPLATIIADALCLNLVLKGQAPTGLQSAVRLAVAGNGLFICAGAAIFVILAFGTLRQTVASRLWWAMLVLPAGLLGIGTAVASVAVAFTANDGDIWTAGHAFVPLLMILPIGALFSLYVLGRWILAPKSAEVTA